MHKSLILCIVMYAAFFSRTVPAGATEAAIIGSSSVPAVGQQSLIREARHELTMLPQYSLFDWIEFEVRSDNSVVLRGQVRGLTLKADAESAVKRIEGVTGVVNEIENLPPSPGDDQIRKKIYHAIYDEDGPLFRYAIEVVPTIHIIVKNGTVTLKGIVDSISDSDFAYAKARGVSNVFSVKNELHVKNQ